MNPLEIAKKCFDEGKVMQLGTSHEGHPRVNSVYYITSDDYHNVYWMSEPRRQHSKDIKVDPRVAGAIAIDTNWPVVGLQFIGMANEVDDLDEIKDITDKYNAKYDYVAEGFVERYKAGRNKHLFYRLALTSLELFDQENFAGDPVEVPLD